MRLGLPLFHVKIRCDGETLRNLTGIFTFFTANATGFPVFHVKIRCDGETLRNLTGIFTFFTANATGFPIFHVKIRVMGKGVNFLLAGTFCSFSRILYSIIITEQAPREPGRFAAAEKHLRDSTLFRRCFLSIKIWRIEYENAQP